MYEKNILLYIYLVEIERLLIRDSHINQSFFNNNSSGPHKRRIIKNHPDKLILSRSTLVVTTVVISTRRVKTIIRIIYRWSVFRGFRIRFPRSPFPVPSPTWGTSGTSLLWASRWHLDTTTIHVIIDTGVIVVSERYNRVTLNAFALHRFGRYCSGLPWYHGLYQTERVRNRSWRAHGAVTYSSVPLTRYDDGVVCTCLERRSNNC